MVPAKPVSFRPAKRSSWNQGKSWTRWGLSPADGEASCRSLVLASITERECSRLTTVQECDILPLGNMKHEQLYSAADVGKLILAERKRQKLSQLQLAGLANTGIRFISDLENGKGTVQLQKLLAVISALGLCMFVYSPWSDS